MPPINPAKPPLSDIPREYFGGELLAPSSDLERGRYHLEEMLEEPAWDRNVREFGPTDPVQQRLLFQMMRDHYNDIDAQHSRKRGKNPIWM